MPIVHSAVGNDTALQVSRQNLLFQALDNFVHGTLDLPQINSCWPFFSYRRHLVFPALKITCFSKQFE